MFRPIRFISVISVFSFLYIANISAQAQDLPVVSCTSPDWTFNTGVSASTGNVLTQGTLEPRWEYAAHFTEDTETYTPPAQWSTPVIRRLAAHPFFWAIPDSADWISPAYDLSASKYTYYRFRFDMDPTIDPTKFQVGVNFQSDDKVLAVFINGTKSNDAAVSGGYVPQDELGRWFTKPSHYNLGQGWQAGTNEIVLLVSNDGSATLTNPRPYGGIVVQGLAMCGGASINKNFSPSEIQAGETSTLTIRVNNLTTPNRGIQSLFIEDRLPLPLQIAGVPSTTCLNTTISGSDGDDILTLVTSDSTPDYEDSVPTDGCEITVPVRWPLSAASQCVGNTVTNTITPGIAPTGQFSTALGFDLTPATADLKCISSASVSTTPVPVQSMPGLIFLAALLGLLGLLTVRSRKS